MKNLFFPTRAEYDKFVCCTKEDLAANAVAIAEADSAATIVTGIVAFAGGGQGSATEISYGYTEISTVATGGDSVKFFASTTFNKKYVIKNSGANAVDIFPASGGNLGAGVDTAVSLASGAVTEFVTTAANVATQF